MEENKKLSNAQQDARKQFFLLFEASYQNESILIKFS